MQWKLSYVQHLAGTVPACFRPGSSYSSNTTRRLKPGRSQNPAPSTPSTQPAWSDLTTAATNFSLSPPSPIRGFYQLCILRFKISQSYWNSIPCYSHLFPCWSQGIRNCSPWSQSTSCPPAIDLQAIDVLKIGDIAPQALTRAHNIHRWSACRWNQNHTFDQIYDDNVDIVTSWSCCRLTVGNAMVSRSHSYRQRLWEAATRCKRSFLPSLVRWADARRETCGTSDLWRK